MKKKPGRPPKKKVKPVKAKQEIIAVNAPPVVPTEGLCKTPGCSEPLASDQPNMCLTHTRRN